MTFEFRVPEEKYFHSVKMLMNKEYGPFDWNYSLLADVICNQKYIGNVLTMEDDNGDEILAFNTIVPIMDI